MRLLKGRSASPLGLDIGSASVKLVALSGRGTQCRVDGFAIEPLPAATVDRGNISDAAIVGEAVRRACDKAGTKRKAAILAVADSAVMTRTLLLDATLAEDELEAEVVLEAERCVPYPIESVALDYARLGAFEGDAALCRVLLVACPSEQIAACEAALAHAGIRVSAVEVESLAQRRAARFAADANGERAAVALLDVGASALRLLVCEGSEASFIKHEPLSRIFGEDDEPALLEAASRLLAAHAAARPAHAIERLLLAGGGAVRPDFAAAAGERLGLAVRPANPFADMTTHPDLDGSALATAAPVFVTACGLGLRSRP